MTHERTLVTLIMPPYGCPFVVLGIRRQDTLLDQVFISAYRSLMLHPFSQCIVAKSLTFSNYAVNKNK